MKAFSTSALFSSCLGGERVGVERGTRATNHSLGSSLNLAWRAQAAWRQVCWRPLCPYLPAQACLIPPPTLWEILCATQLVPLSGTETGPCFCRGPWRLQTRSHPFLLSPAHSPWWLRE